MTLDWDPDNPDVIEIERQIREEQERQQKPNTENNERYSLGTGLNEETDGLGEDTIKGQIQGPSSRYRTNGFKDSVEEEVINLMGYKAGTETPEMLGEIVLEEANHGLVMAEYVLSENLVDTSEGVRVPVIDAHVSPQEDLLSVAYERGNLEIDVRRGEKGNYNVKVLSETPENLYTGVEEVAKFLAEFEAELTDAYTPRKQEGTSEWSTGRVTEALEREPSTEPYHQTERELLRG